MLDVGGSAVDACRIASEMKRYPLTSDAAKRLE
jgi:hypothetical protein